MRLSPCDGRDTFALMFAPRTPRFATIKDKILAGLLPQTLDAQARVISGNGRRCGCCGRRITRDKAGCEFTGDAAAASVACLVHIRCYQLWFNALRVMHFEATQSHARTVPPQARATSSYATHHAARSPRQG
jgi:hypothetical protein